VVNVARLFGAGSRRLRVDALLFSAMVNAQVLFQLNSGNGGQAIVFSKISILPHHCVYMPEAVWCYIFARLCFYDGDGKLVVKRHDLPSFAKD